MKRYLLLLSALFLIGCSDYSCPTYEGTMFYNYESYSPPRKHKPVIRKKATQKVRRAEQD